MCQFVAAGGWLAEVGEQNSWIEADFGRIVGIEYIATQSRVNGHARIATYTLSYSSDGLHYDSIRDDVNGDVMVFTGNAHQHATDITENQLPSCLTTRHFRLTALTYGSATRAGLRWEVYSCTYVT